MGHSVDNCYVGPIMTSVTVKLYNASKIIADRTISTEEEASRDRQKLTVK